MRTDNISNKIAFGSVYMTVYNNNQTGIFEECFKLKHRLLKEADKKLYKAQDFYKPNSSKFGEFDFFIACRKKSGKTNFKGENDLIKRLQKWTKKMGFKATIKDSVLLNEY